MSGSIQTTRDVIARFDADMEEIYFRAKREAGYKARYFLQMVKEIGRPGRGAPAPGDGPRELRIHRTPLGWEARSDRRSTRITCGVFSAFLNRGVVACC